MTKNMAVIGDNNEVLNIICCNDDEPETTNLISYTDENPAYIGGDYIGGYFYPPKPYPSWSRGDSGNWIPPTPMPVQEGKLFFWVEDDLNWQSTKN